MGNTSKLRRCVPARRSISMVECRNNRHRRHACPADCPFNPFSIAHLSELPEREERLDSKILDRLVSESADPEAVTREIDRTEEFNEFFSVLHRLAFVDRPAGGKPRAERWLQQRLPTWQNDEYVLLKSRQRLRAGLFEVRRVLSPTQIELTDVFDPKREPLVLADPPLAARLSPFACFASWVYPLPHFWRVSGDIIPVPSWPPHSAREVLLEVGRHLGGPEATAALNPWLTTHLVRVQRALAATAEERDRLFDVAKEGQFGAADFALLKPFHASRALLEDIPELLTDRLGESEITEGFTDARIWTAVKKGRTGIVPILGRLLIGRKYWRITAIGKPRLDDLRGKLETAMGSRVRFIREHRRKISAGGTPPTPSGSRSLVPPRLIESVAV